MRVEPDVITKGQALDLTLTDSGELYNEDI